MIISTSTSYLGLKLSTPLIIGASPLADDTANARELEDMGAGAIVMRSLFEEQINLDSLSGISPKKAATESGAQQDAYFPSLSEYQLSPDRYLRQIADLKASLGIPVIASLNGSRPGGWIDYARRFEAAGADAIELNLYRISTNADLSASEVEAEMIETVRQVNASVRIPLAVKLQPFHTSLVHFVRELEQAGAGGVVVFNRFYQSEFTIDDLESEPKLHLSDPSELLLRLRWIAILSPTAHCSLAATGGVHGSAEAVKAILAGAHAVQLVSALLKQGPRYLSTVLDGLKQWMDAHGLHSLEQFRGAMNLAHCPDAAAFERGSYERLLQSWRV
jgi:dihydroorotate dehydrogenase (fumarate)